MSYEDAKRMGRLSAGHILALDGACIAENWDPSVTEESRDLAPKTGDPLQSLWFPLFYSSLPSVSQCFTLFSKPLVVRRRLS